MTRYKRFTARFSQEEQTLLIHVAAILRRSKSDTLRFLLYEKAEELGLNTNYLPPFPLSVEAKQPE
jgi:hypothetical protein